MSRDLRVGILACGDSILVWIIYGSFCLGVRDTWIKIMPLLNLARYSISSLKILLPSINFFFSTHCLVNRR